MGYSYLDSLAIYGVGGAHPGGLRLTKQILGREKIKRNTEILDVGCGTGQTSAYIFRKYQCNVTSLDRNKMMVDKAKERFRLMNFPVNVIHGRIEDLPFENRVFDFILSESVTAFTDIPISLSEYKRVLKTSGVLLAIEMVVMPQTCTEEEKRFIADFYGVSDLLTEIDWCNYFRKSGFRNITAEKFLPEFDPHDESNANDFILSNQIDEKHFEILDQHQQIVNRFKDKLGFRVFRCGA